MAGINGTAKRRVGLVGRRPAVDDAQPLGQIWREIGDEWLERWAGIQTAGKNVVNGMRWADRREEVGVLPDRGAEGRSRRGARPAKICFHSDRSVAAYPG
ncbi:hypothetical protein GCM10009558_011830 [Virgisporangium aurantiacum]